MSTQAKTQIQRARRANRTRTKISGTSDRPRLSVFVSSKHISAQLVDDTNGKTLAQATSAGIVTGNLTEKAQTVGKNIAEKAQKAKIKSVVFDRGSRQYHGRIKALADAAREAGLTV